MSGRSVLVTGGSGLLGRPLVACLLARGASVRVLCRRPPWAASESEEAWTGPAGASAVWVPGDVAQPRLGLDEARWAEVVADTATIVHLAARTDFTGRDYAEYERVNVQGTRHVIELAAAARASLHHISTAFVCGDHAGTFAETDLDCGQGFHNHYERSKHAAERVVRQEGTDRKVPWTIHRPGIVVECHPTGGAGGEIGPLHTVAAIARLAGLRAAGAPALRLRGDAGAGLPLVFDHAVACAIDALVARGDGAGKTFHLVGPEPVPNRLLEDAVNEAFGRRVVGWASDNEWTVLPPTSEERLLDRRCAVYAPYHALRVRFDRVGVDALLGRDAVPTPTREELEDSFVTHLEATGQAVRSPRGDVRPPGDARVTRYFDEFLPGFVGRSLLAELTSLNATFWIDVQTAGVWSLAVRAGVLERVERGVRLGEFGYETEPETLLQVASGAITPQESFFRGKTHLSGQKVEALRTVTVLEEFFRKYPFRPEAPSAPVPERPTQGVAPSPSCPAGWIPLAAVPEHPWHEVIALSRKHLNRGLIDLLEVGEFTAIDPVRAEGAHIIDRSGRRILDLVSSYGALNLGHNHPRVRAALDRFHAEARLDLSKELVSRYGAALAHNLSLLTPGDLDAVYFCNSGAEAVEAALKLAQRYFDGKRSRFVYARGSMHGKTIGALSVTGGEVYRDCFRLLPQIEVPYGDADALERAMSAAPRKGEGALAGVILEPIQGEAGVVVPPAGYLTAARALCDRHGVLLILDEVQTAFGRTGRMFACQHEGVVPDILATAKSLGAGMISLAATISRSAVYRRAYGSPSSCLVQTTTFGGRASACAAGLAGLEALIADDLPARAEAVGGRLLQRLRAVAARHSSWIADVRGRGLMIGIEFRADLVDRLGSLPLQLPGVRTVLRKHIPGMVAAALLKQHDVLCTLMLNHKGVLRVYPALVAAEAELERFCAALDQVLDQGFDTLVGERVRRSLSRGGLKFLFPWIASWSDR